MYGWLKPGKTQNRLQKTKKYQHNKYGKYKQSKESQGGLCLNKRTSYGLYELIDLFNKRELATTETELKDMAAAANTGCNKIPYAGYNTPAARGIPKTL